MTSLRRILLDKSTLNGIPQLTKNDLETIIDAVSEWLQQKRYAETWCGHVRDYKKLLLEELKE